MATQLKTPTLIDRVHDAVATIVANPPAEDRFPTGAIAALFATGAGRAFVTLDAPLTRPHCATRSAPLAERTWRQAASLRAT